MDAAHIKKNNKTKTNVKLGGGPIYSPWGTCVCRWSGDVWVATLVGGGEAYGSDGKGLLKKWGRFPRKKSLLSNRGVRVLCLSGGAEVLSG